MALTDTDKELANRFYKMDIDVEESSAIMALLKSNKAEEDVLRFLIDNPRISRSDFTKYIFWKYYSD